ncbi:MAG: hypothetical protein Q9210_005505, partial [Variospora velana]
MSTLQDSSAEDPVRLARLNNLFHSVNKGDRSLKSSRDGDRYIESLCCQSDPAACIDQVLHSPAGMSALQSSIRFDLSSTFLNGPASKLLSYLQHTELGSSLQGALLRQVLASIAGTALFWNALEQAFRREELLLPAQISFGWLLMQLMRLPEPHCDVYYQTAREPRILDTFLKSRELPLRTIGSQISHLLSTWAISMDDNTTGGAGGRHDNDFVDFRQVAILPTADELVSKEPPFLRLAESLDDPDVTGNQLAMHLDNQFRLYREDMLGELREEILIALGQKKGRHRGIVVEDMRLLGVDCGTEAKRQNWGLLLQCQRDLPQLRNVKAKDRKQAIESSHSLLRHQSLTCLILDGEISAFPSIHRDTDLLASMPPIITIRFTGAGTASVTRTMLKLKTCRTIKLVQIDTAVFAYEPVLLGLQRMKTLPLADEILFWKPDSEIGQPPAPPRRVIEKLERHPARDIQSLIGSPKSAVLDQSQSTGKSFIGALTAKIIHDNTKKTIIVVCFTNHALDQFMEDLLDIGIPPATMLRLGNVKKTSSRLQGLGLHEGGQSFKLSSVTRATIGQLKQLTDKLAVQFEHRFHHYMRNNVSRSDIMEYLEFAAGDVNYFDAFAVPQDDDGSTIVGKGGKKIGPWYLIDQWYSGRDRGVFSSLKMTADESHVWRLPRPTRQSLFDNWTRAVLEDRVAELRKISAEYDKAQSDLNQAFRSKNIDAIQSKRVIGCTTTAAAKYSHELKAASGDVLLVEEAGEILECHVLTALGENTSQLVLIGDHRQLRPKVATYELSVEKGEGYDLNRSLFERLVLKGFPHHVLTQQHRMRPEISALVRSLTYPDLLDAPATKARPNLRGFQNNLIFVDHRQTEDDIKEVANWRDMTSLSSKQNGFEARMVLRCVKYLLQQGYDRKNLVILTPYLGQLRRLQDELSRDNDPVLNDLDSTDLVRAGLVAPSPAQQSQRKLRLASIDNYQGEESDVVVISLTRSNTTGDIGFMSAPERLNVLLSRARNALIMIGNSETFVGSRKGAPIWTRLFDMLTAGGHMYTGFPVQCVRHPEKKALLREDTDFDAQCPEGGCSEPCVALLSCTIHLCPLCCHRQVDHSKVRCQFPLDDKCDNGHVRSWKCFQNPPKNCAICQKKAAMAREKLKKELRLQEQRDRDAAEHAEQMAALDADVEAKRQEAVDLQLFEERANAIRQKEKDLESARTLVIRTKPSPSPLKADDGSKQPSVTKGEQIKLPETVSNTQSARSDEVAEPQIDHMEFKSAARDDWAQQKRMENAKNDVIDEIMNLVGLEEVKTQVLRVKAKIDTSRRQRSDVKKERFSAAFLGNPGTGKTTVARLYARVLTSLEVLPGVGFVETSGSRLAHGGVAEAKKHVEDLLKAGGGAMFLDEAYQLAQSHNHGGRQVLDFLLAEMENTIGKIVFIVAGYSREMESFFEHNPGLPSRIPYRLMFEDYKDFELLWFLQQQIHKKWSGTMKIQDEEQGLYMRIAAKRVSRGRGRPGFGNARALEIAFSKVTERQADRIKQERKRGLMPDDFWLSKEDLIGPEPSLDKLLKSSVWDKVQKLTGLQAVKDSLQVMIHRIVTNYQRELREKEPIEVSLNRVFLGNPGTGKTSVAKLYGQILSDLGLLSNGEVIIKNPSDFIGQYIGQSESNTKAILASTVGKVLIIDEAYMLYSGSDGGGNTSDSFKTGAIDTIVSEIQSVPGEDRCVLLLGYREKMESMFRNVNPGLSRRFRIEDAFQFDDFSETELREILESKMKVQDLSASDKAKTVAIEVLNRARIRPHFGNAGEVENLLSSAKDRFQKRQNAKPIRERSFDFIFEQQDFDPEFDRVKHAHEKLKVLFEDVVGCEEIITRLAGYQQIVQGMKARDLDPRGQIPMNFLFKGPPGTGKTTTARKMGQVYYDMGFLSSAEVFECSASDLVGQYVGHTGPKTMAKLEKALGKILFIDEAYRLSEGQFASEAVNELVDQLTKPQYLDKIVVILAGYDKDINKLISTNPGLSSRFPEEIVFENMSPERCIELLRKKLGQNQISIPSLEDPNGGGYRTMRDLFKQLAALPSFGNGREVETLAKNMLGFIYRQPAKEGPLTLSEHDATRLTKTMLYERQDRSANMPNTSVEILPRAAAASSTADPQPPWTSNPPPPAAKNTNTAPPAADETKEPPDSASSPTSAPSPEEDHPRDAIWLQLQADAQAHELRQQQDAAAIRKQEDNLARAKAAEAEILAQQHKKAQQDAAAKRELARKREVARKAREALEKARREQAEREEREERAQKRLREMGVCVQGF